MSLPPLQRLLLLGGAAADALEHWRKPLRIVERLQGGLECFGFDGDDPLADLTQGIGAGVGLGGVLERLAQTGPEVALDPETLPRLHAQAAQASGGSNPAEGLPLRAGRYGASVRESAPPAGKDSAGIAAQARRQSLDAQPGTAGTVVGSSPRLASTPAPAPGPFPIGPHEAQARLARRAAAAGAAIAWDGQAVSGRQGPTLKWASFGGRAVVDAAALARDGHAVALDRRGATSKAPPGRADLAPPSEERKSPGSVAFLPEGTDAAKSEAVPSWSTASGLEQVLKRVEAVRDAGSGKRRNRASTWLGTPGGAEGAPARSPLGSPPPGALASAMSRPASSGEGSTVFPGPAQPAWSWEPGSAMGSRSTIGGLRGLALLGQHGAMGGRLGQASSQVPVAPSGVTGASQALTIATSRPVEGDFEESRAPMGIGRGAAASVALDGEALARELAQLLRREAERHGIDLDGVGP